jgi:hypothetical protein
MIETFSSLLRDRAHWEFELLVGFLEMLVFDGIVLGLCWPFIRKHWQHHVDRDKQDTLESPWISGTPLEAPDVWARLQTPDFVSEQVHDWSLTQPGHVKSPEGWDG